MCGWCWEEVAGKAVAAVTGLVGLDVVTMVQQTPPVYMAAWAVLALYALSWLLQKLSSKPPMILTWPLLGGFLKFIEVSGFVRHVPQRVPTIRYHTTTTRVADLPASGSADGERLAGSRHPSSC
jgi:hypothetical protein